MNTKITIGMPVYGGLQPKTFQCLLELVAHGGYDFHIMIAEHGYTIAENRNYITVKALNNKSDYLLMIDADMTFEPNLLDKLLSNKKDVVGVAYHPRYDGGQIIKYLDGEIEELDETHIVKIEESKNPKYKKTFECKATGTGIILIKCNIFYKIKRPWFKFEWEESGRCKLGEDWYFAKVAKEAGFKIYTDPTIKVKHIGEKII